MEPSVLKKEDADAARHLARETRRLTELIDRLYSQQTIFVRPYRYLWFSFLNGLFVVLGSTIGVAILLWVLNRLGYLAGFGQVAQEITNAIRGR